jgi:hypothetical protein
MEKAEALKRERTLRCLHNSISSLYEHYSNGYKRMRQIKEAIEEMAKYVEGVESMDWIKTVERILLSAIEDSWPRENKNEEAAKQEIASFGTLIKEIIQISEKEVNQNQDKYEKLIGVSKLY